MTSLKTNRKWSNIFLTPLLTLTSLVVTACGGGFNLSDNNNNVQLETPKTQQIETTDVVSTPLEAQKMKVALLVPLTGPHREIGQALNQASQLALFDVPSDNFELNPKDTQGTAEGALAAYQSAKQDGVDLILGPLLSNNVIAIKALAKQDNVPIISFSNNRKVAEAGVWTIGFSPESQVQRVTEYAQKQGYQKFAGLFPNSPYGVLVKGTFDGTVAKTGATLVSSVLYDEKLGNLPTVLADLTKYTDRVRAVELEREELMRRTDDPAKQALEDLKNVKTSGDLGFEALLVGAGGAELQQISDLLGSFDVSPAKVRLLGTGLWDDPALMSLPALQGSWLAVPTPSARLEFETTYQETFGQQPPRLATLAYDATALAALLGAGFKQTQEINLAELVDPLGFAGVDGIFRFNENGTVDRGLAILEIENDTAKLIDPAPQSFAVSTTSVLSN